MASNDSTSSPSSMEPSGLQGMSGQSASSTSSPFPTSDMQGQGAAAGTAGGRPEVMERVVRTAHDTIDRLADRAEPHVRRMQEGVSGTSDRMHEQVDHWRETGDEWAESLRETVREHPIGAIATALVAGMLIARLTR